MSFDVYVQWFRDGAPDGVPEERVRDSFGDALKSEDDLGWRLSYGDGMTSDVYLSRHDDGSVHGITVNRPVGAVELWDALYDLLALQNAVFYFPGGGLFVRAAKTGVHLPAEMVEVLGPPTCVTSPDDLLRALTAA